MVGDLLFELLPDPALFLEVVVQPAHGVLESVELGVLVDFGDVDPDLDV